MRDVMLTMILAAMVMAVTVPASMASTVKAPGAAGQSAPIAITVNTAKIFQHSMHIHYGEPIRAVEQQSVRAFALGTLSRLPIFTRPGGEVIVPLGQVLPVLQTAPGNFSVIILGKSVKPVSLAGAPDAEWVVKETVAGGLATDGHPILEIMPRFAGLEGSIQIVATSPHGYPLTYTIGLTSDARRFTPVLSFYRVPHVPPPSPEKLARAKEAKVMAPTVNATQANVDWTMQCLTGDCAPIRPVSMISNARVTFIRLPDDKLPMVLIRNKTGNPLIVPYHMNGKDLVIGTVPYRVDLMLQGARSLAEIRLTNEAGE